MLEAQDVGAGRQVDVFATGADCSQLGKAASEAGHPWILGQVGRRGVSGASNRVPVAMRCHKMLLQRHGAQWTAGVRQV